MFVSLDNSRFVSLDNKRLLSEQQKACLFGQQQTGLSLWTAMVFFLDNNRLVRDLRFADYCALNVENKTEMQRSTDLFALASENFGFTIRTSPTKKTEVMQQPTPGSPYTEPTITVRNQKLVAAEKFVYVSITLSAYLKFCKICYRIYYIP